jgi:hypothetical protein
MTSSGTNVSSVSSAVESVGEPTDRALEEEPCVF